MSSRKMPQRCTVHEESGIRQQGPPAKKAKLDEVLAAHCRADLVTECMKKKKKNTNIIRWLSFLFFGRKWMCFRFVFGRKWNLIFVGIFGYGRKWKKLSGRPPVYIIKRSWSWSWTLGLFLVLVLKLKSWSWSCSWKKVLITSLVQSHHNEHV